MKSRNGGLEISVGLQVSVERVLFTTRGSNVWHLISKKYDAGELVLILRSLGNFHCFEQPIPQVGPPTSGKFIKFLAG